MCVAAGAEGLRADLVLARAAAALAGWEGRAAIERRTTSARGARSCSPTAPGADPLDPPGSPPPGLDDASTAPSTRPTGPDRPRRSSTRRSTAPTTRPTGLGRPPRFDRPGPPAGSDDAVDHAFDRPDSSPPSGSERAADPPAEPEAAPPLGEGGVGDAERAADPGPVAPVVRLATPRTEHPGNAGRRSPATGERGRVVGARPYSGGAAGLAPVPTVAAAATAGPPPPVPVPTPVAGLAPVPVPFPRRPTPRATGPTAGSSPATSASPSATPAPATCSCSPSTPRGRWAPTRAWTAVKGALLGLLVDAYQRRDRVALVTFGGRGAEVVLRPTGSVEVARSRLETCPPAATPRSPTASAPRPTWPRVAATPWLRPLLVVVTDGRATAGADPVAEAMAAAEDVARRRLPAVVVDVEADGAGRLGLARRLAAAMAARHLPLDDLRADRLEAALRTHLSVKRTSMNRRLATALLAPLLLLAAACGADEPEAEADAPSTSDAPAAETSTFPVTVTAENGEVELPAAPERIVSLSPSLTEMLYAIDAGDQVVAVDRYSDHPDGTPVTDLSGFSPNVEAIGGHAARPRPRLAATATASSPRSARRHPHAGADQRRQPRRRVRPDRRPGRGHRSPRRGHRGGRGDRARSSTSWRRRCPSATRPSATTTS